MLPMDTWVPICSLFLQPFLEANICELRQSVPVEGFSDRQNFYTKHNSLLFVLLFVAKID